MPTGKLGGMPACWRVWGNGAQQVVALHCALAHSGAWEGVARALGDDGITLRAPDLPGHGASGPLVPGDDLFTRTTAMALDLIGDGPVDLVGHSFGGVVCLRIALERPDLVRRLALYEPVFFAAAAARGFDLTPIRDFEAPFAAGNRAEAARRFHKLWGLGTPWEQLSSPQRSKLIGQFDLIPASAAAIYDDCDHLLAPGRLEALTAPVLLLEGSLSPAVTAAINAALAARLPDATRQTLPGAAHMGPITHPAEVATEIRRHLGLQASSS